MLLSAKPKVTQTWSRPTPTSINDAMTGGGPRGLMKRALRRAGFEMRRYDPDGTYAKRRQNLLESEAVDLVIDVGAHAGEFGQSLRHWGYRRGIVSFEPLNEQYERLCAVAERDGDWTCKQLALGDRTGEVEIHVSGNDGFSSSVREMAPKHKAADPSSVYVASEATEITTLDLVGDKMLEPTSRVFLKVDTQGFESEVLAGATVMLARCRLVELELGLVELYTGQALFAELVERMGENGLYLTDLEPGFRNKRTGQLLQVDALFRRLDGGVETG
jgi:FkbM family methyltransferase